MIADQFHGANCKSVTQRPRRTLHHPLCTTGNIQPNLVYNRKLHQCGLSRLDLHDPNAGEQTEFDEKSNADWLAERFDFPAQRKPRTHLKQLDAYKRGELCARIEWIKDHLSFTEKDMAKTIRRSPKVLTLNPESNIQPTTDFLQERLQLSDAALSRMIFRCPGILSRGIGESQSLQRNIDWLHDRLLVTTAKQLGKLLVRASVLLTLSVEDNLEPTMDAMQRHLGLDQNETALLFRRAPSLLQSNFSLSTRPKLDWLQERLSLDRDHLRKFVKRSPTILQLKMEETLEPRLVWLQTRLGISAEASKRLVLVCPAILILRIQNLEQKLDFLQSQLGVSLTVDAIAHCPVLLTCSLEARLKPRIEEARDSGIVVDVNCLQRITKCTEKLWEASVSYQVRKLEREAESAANW